ncbi:MAG TPA: sn-glycerol-3-phosphate ABC transporter ATP-binding protein UgpC [Polyangiaceae bacterium]|nr:sn-glycerol-3-phosphate ABC transporter ATP-binding protein UgpC [Polyangiaceae bacterium]
MSSVELEHVEKAFENGVKVVSDLNLAIRDREFIVLVGPSGCGKSTTLRMVAGLETVTSGTISIDQRVVNDVPPKDRDIAMVFQNYALYPHMTVYENMAFGLRMRRFERAAIGERVERAAKVLGIEGLLDRRPKQLSGGQRQRVALGRAIVRDPKCFLFDEPLSNLDAKLRVEMRAELKRLHLELKSTTIYVTHDQEEALTLGDRVVVMHAGVVQQCDQALTVYHHPANRFVAGFLGNPPMNFLEGRIEQEQGALCFNQGNTKLQVPDWARSALIERVGQTVVMGVRPEAIRVGTDPAGVGLSLDATVTLVQPLGDRINAHLATQSHPQLIAQLANASLSLHERVAIHFDPNRLHFFESGANGKNLHTRTGSVSEGP